MTNIIYTLHYTTLLHCTTCHGSRTMSTTLVRGLYFCRWAAAFMSLKAPALQSSQMLPSWRPGDMTPFFCSRDCCWCCFPRWRRSLRVGMSPDLLVFTFLSNSEILRT